MSENGQYLKGLVEENVNKQSADLSCSSSYTWPLQT